MAQLIVYFSRRGENYVSGRIQPLSVGNTEVVARRLQVLTGADLFQLEPVHPYSDNYNQCIEQAQADQRQDARPALRALPDHLEDYDTIYLGYPNYWGTMPMCVFTFLASFDFTGKTILPFCTHEGSGLGRSEADIRRLCPGARVGRGLAILGTAQFGRDAMTEQAAIDAAAAQYDGEYDMAYGRYSVVDGCWTVTFSKGAAGENSKSFKITPQGSVTAAE